MAASENQSFYISPKGLKRYNSLDRFERGLDTGRSRQEELWNHPNSQTVSVRSLNSLLNELNFPTDIDFISIDTENTELNVLKGAKKSLKNSMINFVELELVLCDYYKKKVLLHELDIVMHENNFELFNLQEFSYSKKGQIKWFDMLYINKKFFIFWKFRKLDWYKIFFRRIY
jgi:hypothetical protein